MLKLNKLKNHMTGSLLTPALILSISMLAAPIVSAQEQQSASTKGVDSGTTQAKAVNSSEKASDVVRPKWGEYKGITIGMNADEVRAKLAGLKDQGKVQDFFVLSDAENVQVYYDDQGKVQAISVNYVDARKAPDVVAVLGEEVKANEDGSVYKLIRYPEAGYWVAYSRTAGDAPLITVTIQKM
jgi:hypothetical protein